MDNDPESSDEECVGIQDASSAQEKEKGPSQPLIQTYNRKVICNDKSLVTLTPSGFKSTQGFPLIQKPALRHVSMHYLGTKQVQVLVTGRKIIYRLTRYVLQAKHTLAMSACITVLKKEPIYWPSCVSSCQINTHTPRKKTKTITMMRGKSPRSDVEMTKKLNFVAAILGF